MEEMALPGRVVAEQEPFFITYVMKMTRTNIKWVAQVSILRPGFLLRNRSYRNTQVSKARPGPPT
jgi:hypothetical protein